MAYVVNIALRPTVITNNGTETLQFQITPCTFKEEDVSYATEYFNPITGLFDDQKSTLYFESGESLVIDQPYIDTEAQLLLL